MEVKEIDGDTRMLTGEIRIICIYCGQIRRVYSDGRIIIIQENGEVTRAKTEETSGDTSVVAGKSDMQRKGKQNRI